MSDVDKKREANIAAKKEARAKEVADIKANKAAKAAERQQAEAEACQKKSDAEAKQKEVEEKRAANIAAREAKSKPAAGGAKAKSGSKYSKKDVLELKKVFDDYDKDKSGKVNLDEFSRGLRNKKDSLGPKAGEKSTLAQRKAAEGVSIADLAESAFHEMDTDGDGEVSFEEMLKLMYKLASSAEIAMMLDYVAPEPEPEPEPKPEMSEATKKMIKGIFKTYDKDKSGDLTFGELRKAFEKTGLDPDDIKQYMSEFDADENGKINQEEFLKLMESTGAFDD